MTSCYWHCSTLLSVFVSRPLLRSLKSKGHFANALPVSLLRIPPSSHIQNTNTNVQCSTCTHKHTNTNSSLGGCPKVSGLEGRTQKLRKQLGVREVLCHCLLSCCCVGHFTLHRNNPPSGSPSSFVEKEVNWHHSVPGWTCCWYTKGDGIDLFRHPEWVTLSDLGHCEDLFMLLVSG